MTTSKVGADTHFRDAFLEGAARAFFVMAYADYVENNNDFENDTSTLPRPGPGGDWYDYAPATPPNAYALAGALWAALENANDVSVYWLADIAGAADGKPVDPNEFGRDLAMEYMGCGVSWFDDHAEFDIKIPSGEVSQCCFSADAYKGDV